MPLVPEAFCMKKRRKAGLSGAVGQSYLHSPMKKAGISPSLLNLSLLFPAAQQRKQLLFKISVHE